jgi:hypothetical protein
MTVPPDLEGAGQNSIRLDWHTEHFILHMLSSRIKKPSVDLNIVTNSTSLRQSPLTPQTNVTRTT